MAYLIPCFFTQISAFARAIQAILCLQTDVDPASISIGTPYTTLCQCWQSKAFHIIPAKAEPMFAQHWQSTLPMLTLTQHWHGGFNDSRKSVGPGAQCWPNGQNLCWPDSVDPIDLALAQSGFKGGWKSFKTPVAQSVAQWTKIHLDLFSDFVLNTFSPPLLFIVVIVH